MIVKFIVNASGAVVEKTFSSQYLAEAFMRKLKHSKKCTFVSCRTV